MNALTETGRRMPYPYAIMGDIDVIILVIGAGLENRIRFESNMSLDQHKHFNEILNERVTQSNARGYRGERIHYKHTYETDRFYHPDNNTRTKWRVTTNQQTGQASRPDIL